MRRYFPFLFALCLVACSQHSGTVRTYYIAADEVDWNYLPSGLNGMMGTTGMPPAGFATIFTQRNVHGIGRVYRKAIYREYTDATFTQLKPRLARDAYLGILGPIIHAEVGDTIRVVFRNHGTHPYSMHPHGVTYEKPSEGAGYADGVAPAAKGGDRSHRARRLPIRGTFGRAPVPDPRIQVPSYGSITRTLTSVATSTPVSSERSS